VRRFDQSFDRFERFVTLIRKRIERAGAAAGHFQPAGVRDALWSVGYVVMRESRSLHSP
jgi:hypothetical protein